PHRLHSRYRGGFACQNDERRLKSIFGVLDLMQDAPADAQHHRAVPPHQLFEGHLVLRAHEAIEELAVGQSGCRSELQEGAPDGFIECAHAYPPGAQAPRLACVCARAVLCPFSIFAEPRPSGFPEPDRELAPTTLRPASPPCGPTGLPRRLWP